jgi:hypothetical protein
VGWAGAAEEAMVRNQDREEYVCTTEQKGKDYSSFGQVLDGCMNRRWID